MKVWIIESVTISMSVNTSKTLHGPGVCFVCVIEFPFLRKLMGDEKGPALARQPPIGSIFARQQDHVVGEPERDFHQRGGEGPGELPGSGKRHRSGSRSGAGDRPNVARLPLWES